MHCPACGAEGDPGQFCGTCGAQLPAEAAVQPEAPAAVEPTASAPVPPPVAAPAAAPPPMAPPVAVTPEPPKKKRGCLWGCLSAIFVPIIIVVLVLGWFGFVPGLSKLIGPKPRDLGVEMTVDAAYEGSEALGLPDTLSELQTLANDPNAFSAFDATVSSEQASSLLVLGQSEIPNWPFEFVQIRFNGDGTAEASGVLDFEELTTFLTGNLAVPAGDVETAVTKVMLVSDAPFYIHGTGSVSNNAVSMSVSEMQIGRFTVPGDWYQGKEHVGADYISGALSREGFAIETLGHDANGMIAKGTRAPSSLTPWLGIARDDRVEGIVP